MGGFDLISCAKSHFLPFPMFKQNLPSEISMIEDDSID